MPASSEDARLAPVGFNAQNAENYERVMGRWSRRLAPVLIRFGGLSDGDRVLDVGCGTGNLSLALPQIADVAAVIGIDLGDAYVAYASARNRDPRISFETADARKLRFKDGAFDRVFSMLVLQFIPDAARAVREMARVVRPGGTVTAAVWDDYSGLPHVRMFWDIAGALDPSTPHHFLRPMSTPGEMAALWQALGLRDVEQANLLIRAEFADFEDYWSPFASGEGPVGQFLTKQPAAMQATLRRHVERAFLAGKPDGPRSFACVALACRGTVPPLPP